MRKLTVLLILVCVLLNFSVVHVFSETRVTEKPNIKIIINGTTISCNDVPLIVNGRTMLPLRSLLTNLGVENDDQHIIWNNSENSVTIIKDTTNIYLRVGDSNAKINNIDLIIDSSPINYKDRVYIPVRFIAQSFGKKVAWDEFTNTIYIRDEVEFEKVKSILENAISNFNSIEKYKINWSFEKKRIVNDQKISIHIIKELIEKNLKTDSQYNKRDLYDHKQLKTVEYFYRNSVQYRSDNSRKSWNKIMLNNSSYNYWMTMDDPKNVVNLRDVLFAGLTTISEDTNQIVLQGDVYGIDKLNGEAIKKNDIFNPHLSDTFFQIYIDKGNNFVTKTVRSYITPSGPGSDYICEYTTIHQYSDFNGTFEVSIPNELK